VTIPSNQHEFLKVIRDSSLSTINAK